MTNLSFTFNAICILFIVQKLIFLWNYDQPLCDTSPVEDPLWHTWRFGHLTKTIGCNGLPHLQFIHLLWKMWENVTIEEVWFLNAQTLSVILLRPGLSRREWIIYFEVPKKLIFLNSHSPWRRCFIISYNGKTSNVASSSHL